MAYTVLARKYRSQTFDEVVGQEAIAQTLKNAIQTDRVAHAYLFTGTRGVGKTTTARILAKSLNCLAADKPTVTPCCKCESCTAINVGDDIDVMEIDGASNNGVEEVRRLRENAIYAPARSRYKIYIIDEVHMLSTSAFNALLKTLEEPPPHVKFIFATTEPQKVIPTIQSRCQRFDFSNIPALKIVEQLKAVLKREKLKYDENLLGPLAKLANGSMRDALSLLDRLISTGSQPLEANLIEQYLGCPDSEKITVLVEKIGDGDAAGALETSNDLINTGLDRVQIVDALIDYMRDLMVIKTAGADSEILILTEQQRRRAGELAEKFDAAALVYNITALEKLRWSVKNSETGRALLEAALVRFALSEHFLNVDSLVSGTQGGSSADIKKNKTSAPAVEKVDNKPRRSQVTDRRTFAPPADDLPRIKKNWEQILDSVAEHLGNGTRIMLSSASVTSLKNGLLTLTFPSSEESSMRMCESPATKRQIESAVSKHGGPVRIKFAAQPAAGVPETAPKSPVLSTDERHQIANHPAVKTIITELGATITDITEQ